MKTLLLFLLLCVPLLAQPSGGLPRNNPAFTGTMTGPNLSLTALTTTRVPFLSTGGSFVDSAVFTYTTGTGTLAVPNLSLSGALSTGVGGSTAGVLELGEGTAPSDGTTSWKLYTPTSVTSYKTVVPGATGTGFWLGTNSGTTETITRVTPAAGVATFIATPSGANLASALTSDIPGTAIADTAVTPGSYTNTSLTVDQQGRITAASSGSAGGSNNAALFTSTANAAADNTTTETSIVGTGVGSKTTAANYFAAGTSIIIRVSGYLSTPAVPDNLTIRVKAGSTTVGSAVFTLPLNLTNQVFRIDALVTCRTAGASGTFMMNDIVLSTNSTLTATISSAALNTAAVTLDTTGTLAWDVTADWGAAQSGETITGTNALVFTPGNGAVVDPGANGFMDRTSLNTTVARTLTGTTNQIAITNGGGGGNPVFSFTGVEKIAVFSVDGGGSAITTGTVSGTARIPFACTLTGYSITATANSGTITVNIWLKATATSIPTISDNINTSGVTLVTNTAVASGTLTDFTDTVYAAGDMARCAYTVTGNATDLTVTLYGTRL